MGTEVWIKRDDLSGLALGGNKVRKLEYLLAEAVARKCDTVITCGGVHSNFIRILAAACARLGLRCEAVVMDLPYEHRPAEGTRLSDHRGNPLLSELFGAILHRVPDDTWEALYALSDSLAERLRSKGREVYQIPVGGSSPLGAYAFFKAGREVIESGEEFDWVVTASSSGSTQTGLAYAFSGRPTRVLGICSDPEPEMVVEFATIGVSLAEMVGTKTLLAQDFRLSTDFVGTGYGIPSEAGNSAVQYLARTEGILLDPIYTGKAFAGLLQLISSNGLGGKVLFWHTGGVPSLFA